MTGKILARMAGSALILLSVTAPTAAATFDGPWRVEIKTRRGGCDPLYRYYVVVDNGQVRVRSMSGQLGRAAGRISENGRVLSRIGNASDPVEIRGRLKRSTGGGTWHAPTRGCSGVWTAARR
ncbi:hypothetical protein [Microvirga roseola]|uniref:hypothetical protein n=1 Tax=Microvirga roseola TaxID=2883126 RepID=UPI001E654F09|nr:hypothetical protein [Microvirga roseola]